MSWMQGIRNSNRWDLTTYKQHLPYMAGFLSILLASIGRSERRVATARYVEGLLLPGRRKFIRPLAERLKVDPQSLQQAITHSPWDDQEVWSALRSEMVPLLEPLDLWVIHERAWAKQGPSTVGVGNQRCGAEGKKAHCQVSLELLVSDGTIAAPAAGRLYLPENWAADVKLREATEIPDAVEFTTKPGLAIELLKEVVRDGVLRGTVIADASYGNDANIRSALLNMDLEFFLEINPELHRAWDFQGTGPHWDKTLQPHSYSLDRIVKTMPLGEWRNCCWLEGDDIPRRTRLAIREIFLEPNASQTPRQLERLWLVVDHPTERAQPYRCYLAHFKDTPREAKCLRLSRCHHYLEHYHRRLEGDLDLTCYQGRSWKGFHHHLVLSAAAYLFTLMVELRSRRAFWSDLKEDIPIDPQIAAEIARFSSVLLGSGSLPRNEPLEAPIELRRRKAANGDGLSLTN